MPLHCLRFIFVASFILLPLAGCNGATPSGQSADLASFADIAVAADMAVPADLAPPADLTRVPDLSRLDCAHMVACTRGCAGPNSGNCVSACIAQGSDAAMTYFQPLEQCAGPACSQNATDAGPPPCSLDPSSQACIECVMKYCQAQLTACEAH